MVLLLWKIFRSIKSVCSKFARNIGCHGLVSCWIRTFLILFVFTFLWIQVTFGGRQWLRSQSDTFNPRHIQLGKFIRIQNESKADKKLTSILPIVQEDVIGSMVKEDVIADLRLKIEEANRMQTVYNEDVYGPLKDDSVVFIVQVHNRLTYLKYLIESLARVKYIDQVLLIFSHDVYDEKINTLIQGIMFCKVMQIFLPYSLETHPDTFPGNDPRDCPKDIGKAKAMEIKCLNAEHPDKYGNYRESKFTQIKHHWWWKMNHVFNHLRITATYSGPVVFLEEDHYIVDDVIHMLKLMDEKCRSTKDCHFLGLGTHEKLKPYRVESDGVEISVANTNLGLAFSRETYLNWIVPCAKEFCEYDDYNWDWSLNYVTNVCNKVPLLAMISSVPRAFHIGECGTHVHKNDCQESRIVSTVRDVIKKIDLYPSSVEVVGYMLQKPRFKQNGGWGDKRDQELCVNMTKR